MNNKSWITILVATTTVGFASPNAFSQSSNAETPYPKDRISFRCGEFLDKASGETIPATVAYVPQRKASVSVIAWKSNYIPEWDAQTRCETVSPKFQSFYEDGRLYLLTTGVSNGYDIVCAAVKEGQPCEAEDQLFQVKASSDPQAVLKGLTGIYEGSASEPIYQSSGDKIYISVDKLLNAAPAIEEGDLTAN
jgi:hypothetical protein